MEVSEGGKVLEGEDRGIVDVYALSRVAKEIHIYNELVREVDKGVKKMSKDNGVSPRREECREDSLSAFKRRERKIFRPEIARVQEIFLEGGTLTPYPDTIYLTLCKNTQYCIYRLINVGRYPHCVRI